MISEAQRHEQRMNDNPKAHHRHHFWVLVLYGLIGLFVASYLS